MTMPERTESFRTPQEDFWAGAFGDAYVERNQGESWVAANTALFAAVLGRTHGVRSVLEVGANIGLNLLAIRRLLPQAELTAIEINTKAVERLRALGGIDVRAISLLDFEPDRRHDLVLSKGVLIHMEPRTLPAVYATLHRASSRYVCLAEYYSPTPVEVPYRGHQGFLFKRDFAGEMLDQFSDLRLLDYGFAYHRDPHFPQDDLNWFLLEKT